MFMRTRDYRAIRIEPDLAPLEYISDSKNGDFCQNMTISIFLINRPDRPILIKESYGKLCILIFNQNP